VPTHSPCAAIINEFGSHEQKLRRLPPIFRGDQVWAQLLSEPGGGSDAAGAQTLAVRDGDDWVLNGSKIWSTGAWWCDWGLWLARTNVDVPKHSGLSVFMVPINQTGMEIQRIEMLNGSREFCQEFMTDMRVPESDRLGVVDDGWTIGTRWMAHEKSLGISHWYTRPKGTIRGVNPWAPTPVAVARQAGLLEDPVARQLVGEAHALKVVGQEASLHIARGLSSERFPAAAASMTRIITSLINGRLTTINFELAGSAAVAWEEADAPLGDLGVEFLTRQAMQITGGTVEMQRNGVSERLLGMPKEARKDLGVPFREVPRQAPRRA
jgi:alkylation response protein AidB-like acyl-CoA dehydrogenase